MPLTAPTNASRPAHLQLAALGRLGAVLGPEDLHIAAE